MINGYAILPIYLLNLVDFNITLETSADTVRTNSVHSKFIIEYDDISNPPEFLTNLYLENRNIIFGLSQQEMYVIMDSEEWNSSNDIAVDDLDIN